MVKRVLMIAFHFPPLRGSSGIQRTLKFAQYLPQFGWTPVVISAHPRVQRETLAEADHTFSRRVWRDQVSAWTGNWVTSW